VGGEEEWFISQIHTGINIIFQERGTSILFNDCYIREFMEHFPHICEFSKFFMNTFGQIDSFHSTPQMALSGPMNVFPIRMDSR
jgi:hypothetical protein